MTETAKSDWHFWIDVGGTFTDCLAIDSLDPDKQYQTKVLSELDRTIPAPLLAIRKILKLDPADPIPDCSVHLGTTRGTNALLTRNGARTAFVTTRGFRDLLTIGDQARPHLFKLTVVKPQPLFETSIEVDERVLADGTVEVVPDLAMVRRQLMELKSSGIESVAICLMHGFRYPKHEQLIGEVARKIGFKDVRLSSDVAPLIKILARGETTVLDAYLNPVLGDYLDQIQSGLSSNSQLRLMTSAGGLVRREKFSGKDSVLSGPAGGIVGAARVAEQAGFKRVLTFDMGGTSSDVGRYDGEIELEFETRKADVRIMTPMVAIETVAAGGGSVCWFDGTKLMVGPQSATSDPGPACYGRGGPLAVTDINLFLGRIVKHRFPFPLDEAAVENRLEEVRRQMADAGFEMTHHELAAGFLAIANQNMASAIRSVSIARGYDPKDYVLIAFGGAGPQHCCAVAEAIGMEKILDHPQGSILSAVGIRLADQTVSAVRSVLTAFDESSLDAVNKLWESMESELADSFDDDQVQFTHSLDLRYFGTEVCQTIRLDAKKSDRVEQRAQLENDFAKVHQQRFGFTSDRPLEIVAARAEGRRTGSRLLPSAKITKTNQRHSDKTQSMWQSRSECDSATTGWQKVATEIFDRESLSPGDRVVGPAMIAGELSTTVVDAGWEATTLADGQILLSRLQLNPGQTSFKDTESLEVESKVDPVKLEIFNNHFSTIARQMGISLQMTSMSVNVKERLDFSCAIFTQAGDLVVNAPHIPVHLGAMSETVRAIIRLNENVNPGDVFVTNDPFAGGSHLPDVTVITPVFNEASDTLLFWVASRSHHSEIGGISPGSMPPNAICLAEEGVLIRNFKLICGSPSASKLTTERFEELENLLTAPPYPSRSPTENLADVRAQVASNRTGERDLLALVKQYSQKTVLSYMTFIQNAAEQKVRSAILQMSDGQFAFEDSLDNGATIRVKIDKQDDQISIDFTGTDPVLDGNLNANPAIVSSAVIYVMRCLIDEDIPLNEGVMKPVTVKLPECFLNPTSDEDPAKCPAVVGGNVETSQRVVDVLLGAIGKSVESASDRLQSNDANQQAIGLAAASQGTMNNWLMGNGTFGYYETIGGGTGATPVADGADAVHSHMTNTRLTDPEVLESRYPVILREFSIREESGGAGWRSGGNGMIREVEFLQPLTVSLLTNRRKKAPYGIGNGRPGKPGINWLIKNYDSKSREATELPNSCQIEVKPGDVLRLETPGGGGFG
ncbi:MAG: hydantoinase B/oxoprolinase family protein [Mariniblastus sp.]